jgi:methionyl-tRNA formyltransferase
LKIVFFGTPDFAVPALESLLGSAHEVLAVVTQPDRQSGRGRKIKSCAVKIEALNADLRVLQPQTVKDPAFVDEVKNMNPEVIVVVAYGQILPPELIHLPQKGCINIHASLLPNYRGAAPINWALIHGDRSTGITIMQMDEGMDTGPILLQEELEILPDDTAGSLSARLSKAGGPLLITALDRLENDKLKPYPQEGGATYAAIMKKSDGFIEWERTAAELNRFIRGMNPWPGAYGFIEKERYKILNAVPVDGTGKPGVITTMTKEELKVGTGSGLLSVLEIQPAGKPVMTVHAFLQGSSLKEGMRFTLSDD